MTYTKPDPAVRIPARSYAFLSVGAALITIILKSAAYLLTGSVGLLSDALESLVNVVWMPNSQQFLRLTSQDEQRNR